MLVWCVRFMHTCMDSLYIKIPLGCRRTGRHSCALCTTPSLYFPKNNRSTLCELGQLADVDRDVGGAAVTESGAKEPIILVGLHGNIGGEVGDPHAPISGAEQRRDQVPRHESPAAGHRAHRRASWPIGEGSMHARASKYCTYVLVQSSCWMCTILVARSFGLPWRKLWPIKETEDDEGNAKTTGSMGWVAGGLYIVLDLNIFCTERVIISTWAAYMPDKVYKCNN